MLRRLKVRRATALLFRLYIQLISDVRRWRSLQPDGSWWYGNNLESYAGSPSSSSDGSDLSALAVARATGMDCVLNKAAAKESPPCFKKAAAKKKSAPVSNTGALESMKSREKAKHRSESEEWLERDDNPKKPAATESSDSGVAEGPTKKQKTDVALPSNHTNIAPSGRGLEPLPWETQS
jgi:hypothetical protein